MSTRASLTRSLGYVPHLLEATKYEGTATSTDDLGKFIPMTDPTQPVYEASLTLYVPDDPNMRETCTSAWGCDPKTFGTGIHTSGVNPKSGFSLCGTVPGEDGSITEVFQMEGSEVKPPEGFKFPAGHTRYFELPVIVIARDVRIPRTPTAQSTKTAAGKVYEEPVWGDMDRDHRLTDVQADECAPSGDSQGGQSTAQHSSRDTQL